MVFPSIKLGSTKVQYNFTERWKIRNSARKNAMMQTFLQASRDNQNVQETQAILKNENQGSIIATKVIDQEKGSSRSVAG